MKRLVKTTAGVLGVGILVLAGAGVLVVAGTGIASARPASTCQTINATLANLVGTLAAAPHTPSGRKTAVATIASQLTQAVSTGSTAVKDAVSTFVTDLETGVAANDINFTKLSADGDAIVAACAVQATPSGAPATGGGSAAGVQDPALFGVGGAAVLAGIVVLGLARRTRPRTGAGQG